MRPPRTGFYFSADSDIMTGTSPGLPGDTEVNMKAAVVYYSRSGITKKIAEKVQAKFNADMIFVEPEKAYKSFP